MRELWASSSIPAGSSWPHRRVHKRHRFRGTVCRAATEQSRSPAEIEEAQKQAPRSTLVTGGRLGSAGSGRKLLPDNELPLAADKQIVLVRHGMSEWNVEGRIQGSSNEPELTQFGRQQAQWTREALENYPFQACFASPITRALESAEDIWRGRDGPLVQLESLREAHLGYLQGMKNDYAKEHHAEVYMSADMWRTQPEKFEIDGMMPVPAVFEAATDAWASIIRHESDCSLVVTHKSVLRALVCVALGLGPSAFRAVDIHNSGVSVFWVNKNGEPMLQNLNLTTHLATSVKY